MYKLFLFIYEMTIKTWQIGKLIFNWQTGMIDGWMIKENNELDMDFVTVLSNKNV